METISYDPPGPVAAAFHGSGAFVRGLMGPVGSGKSTACVMELFARSVEQYPDRQGVRRSRWLCIRNTYGELKSTTIKTVQEWLPNMVFRWDAPIVGTLDFRLGDKTRVISEWLFISVDNPADTAKLRSLEVTGAWLNEASEIALGVFEMATQRVGRYPPKKSGQLAWSGVIWDSNPPHTDHWIYRLHETEQVKGYEIYKQPPALLEDGQGYRINPDAENLKNHVIGGEYYLRQVHGKKKEWIDVFLRGQYGVITDGKAVYPEYSDEVHCKRVDALGRLPIILGIDLGRTPAAVFCQVTPRGQFRVLDELYAEDMGIGSFVEDVVKPHIAQFYREFNIVPVADPAGIAKESDERTAFDVMREHGIVAMPATTNRLTGRLEAVKRFLSRMIDGLPGFVIDPKCDRLRKGFIGLYYFRKLQINGERVKEVPEKNDYSHVHDALQYAALYATLESVNDGVWNRKIEYPKVGIV
jgi:hypothetical protein